MKLPDFSESFSKRVFMLYKHHEETFDTHKIHGVLHIGRSLVASYIIHAQIEKEILRTRDKDEPEYKSTIENILWAVAFHDSGRQGNGIDYWEGFSANNCFMSGHEYASTLIKKNRKTNDYCAMCVYDADVIEIMRPCCGRGGIYEFDKKYLLLLNVLGGFYEKLIPEWWSFVQHTEAIKEELSVPNIIDKLVEIIEENKDKFPIIFSNL